MKSTKTLHMTLTCMSCMFVSTASLRIFFVSTLFCSLYSTRKRVSFTLSVCLANNKVFGLVHSSRHGCWLMIKVVEPPNSESSDFFPLLFWLAAETLSSHSSANKTGKTYLSTPHTAHHRIIICSAFFFFLLHPLALIYV